MISLIFSSQVEPTISNSFRYAVRDATVTRRTSARSPPRCSDYTWIAARPTLSATQPATLALDAKSVQGHEIRGELDLSGAVGEEMKGTAISNPG